MYDRVIWRLMFLQGKASQRARVQQMMSRVQDLQDRIAALSITYPPSPSPRMASPRPSMPVPPIVIHHPGKEATSPSLLSSRSLPTSFNAAPSTGLRLLLTPVSSGGGCCRSITCTCFQVPRAAWKPGNAACLVRMWSEQNAPAWPPAAMMMIHHGPVPLPPLSDPSRQAIFCRS